MSAPDLPRSLRELEVRLAQRPATSPPAHLRAAVLDAVSARIGRARVRRRFWRSPAAIAAATVLWINFSMSAIADMDWRSPEPVDRTVHEETTRRLTALVPDLSASECERQARLMRALHPH